MRLSKEIDIHIENKIKDKNFDEFISIFKYEGLIRKIILDYKFNALRTETHFLCLFILKAIGIIEFCTLSL